MSDKLQFVVEPRQGKAYRTSNWPSFRVVSWIVCLSGQLLNADQNEFGGLEGRETYDDVKYSRVDVILSCSCFVAPDKESVARFRSLKRSLAKQTSHKGAEARTNLCPKQIIVGLENRPLRSPIKTLFEIKRQAPHRNVFPLTRILIPFWSFPTDYAQLRMLANHLRVVSWIVLTAGK
jgi:hypothetical protein